MRPRHLALAGLLLGSALAASSGAAAPSASVSPIRLVDKPCAGCRAALPPGTEPIPLLVVLHGDWGHGPSELLAAWESHALRRGIGVLALRCPVDLGCKSGSFWKWGGDPGWVMSAVDAVAKVRPIDRERLWLAGWSGGATYIGMHAQAFQRSFSALVYHGGGTPPLDPACGAPHAGVFFLVGTDNPLHAMAVRLRDHHAACADALTWRVLPRADHDAEWRALSAHGGEVVTWLLNPAQRRAVLP